MKTPHMAQLMDGATSELERAVVIEDTTNTKHHNEVMMALTSLALVGCMNLGMYTHHNTTRARVR